MRMRKALDVDCPHCGKSDGERCVQTDADGPRLFDKRVIPHRERVELAREVFE